jgi:hypothetical protein
VAITGRIRRQGIRLNLTTVNQLLKIGPQILQLGIGARYWADSPNGAADGWAVRLQMTLLHPK